MVVWRMIAEFLYSVPFFVYFVPMVWILSLVILVIIAPILISIEKAIKVKPYKKDLMFLEELESFVDDL